MLFKYHKSCGLFKSAITSLTNQICFFAWQMKKKIPYIGPVNNPLAMPHLTGNILRTLSNILERFTQSYGKNIPLVIMWSLMVIKTLAQKIYTSFVDFFLKHFNWTLVCFFRLRWFRCNPSSSKPPLQVGLEPGSTDMGIRCSNKKAKDRQLLEQLLSSGELALTSLSLNAL